jgi:hypothetical protein
MYGVSRYVNPLLMYPLEPLVLLEGKFDRDFATQPTSFRTTQHALCPGG